MIQKFYKLIPLDSKLYYVDSVPVEFNVLNIVLLNAGVFIISALFLILPAILAAKINPVKTINFK
jgi:lipoprotein-releasing system permease protein